MANPQVSVVITAYDRPDFLESAIASVMAQTFRDFELLVVDDCSPRDLLEVVKRFGAGIRFHRQERNGGPSHARNTGVQIARGEYVAFLDDDDIWMPNKLHRQLEAIQGYDACLCGYAIMERGRKVVRQVREVTPELLLYGNRFCGATGFLCRRRVLLDELFDERLAWGEDWDIYVRVARLSAMAYVSEPLFLRRTSNPATVIDKVHSANQRNTDVNAGPLVKQRKWLGERMFRHRLSILYGYGRGAHQSLTSSLKSADIDALERRTATIRKHRGWMGEKVFRDRLAEIYLAYIGSRRDPWKFLMHSLENAGPIATVRTVAKSLMRWCLHWPKGGIQTTRAATGRGPLTTLEKYVGLATRNRDVP